MHIIGIDLGTTNSLCAIFRESPELIPNVHGEFLTPSVVAIDDNGEVLVGQSAKDMRVVQPDKTASCFKRYMGTDEKAKVNGQEFSAPELSSFILKNLKNDAEVYLGEKIEKAVITVPAYFNELQRQATMAAGQLAGLEVLRVINEPTAAALAYGFKDRDSEKNIMVFDLGGGTFDVTVMEIFEGSLEIMASSGESFLGGEDFTTRLASYILSKRNENLENEEFKNPEKVSRLLKECEKAKRSLNEREDISIRMPDSKGNLTSEEVLVTRTDYEEACSDLIERLRKPCLRALSGSSLLPDEIEEIILVGGSTRKYVVHDFIKEFLKKDPLCEINPDEVVAIGASIQAALIKEDKAVDDIVMTDVCPFTLGIEIVKSFNGRHEDGYYLPIIHRNTTIPVSKEEIISTLHPNQNNCSIVVYQGEHRKVKQNIKLGELEVQAIPKGPAGQEINVRFSFDVNGILEVEALIPETKKKFKTVLTNHVKSLNKSEIDDALKKLQKIKFYPRDKEENKRLLLFCEQLVGELNKHQREEFEVILDQFEFAMNASNKELFESTKEHIFYLFKEWGINYSTDS